MAWALPLQWQVRAASRSKGVGEGSFARLRHSPHHGRALRQPARRVDEHGPGRLARLTGLLIRCALLTGNLSPSTQFTHRERVCTALRRPPLTGCALLCDGRLRDVRI